MPKPQFKEVNCIHDLVDSEEILQPLQYNSTMVQTGGYLKSGTYKHSARIDKDLDGYGKCKPLWVFHVTPELNEEFLTILHSNKKNMDGRAIMKAWIYNGQPKSAA